MKFKVVYNPEFYVDIMQAVDWYNEKQPGLGDKFFIAVKKFTKKTINFCLTLCNEI